MDKENQKTPKLCLAFGSVQPVFYGPDIEYTICPIMVGPIPRGIMIQKVRRKVERVVWFCRGPVFWNSGNLDVTFTHQGAILI